MDGPPMNWHDFGDLFAKTTATPEWKAGLLRGAANAREDAAAEPGCSPHDRARHWARAAALREAAR